MIVDLIEHRGYLLAINDNSQLLVWNLSSHLVGKHHLFPHSVSLLPTTASHRHQQPLLAIIKTQQHAVLHNSHSLLKLQLDLLPQIQQLIEIDLGEAMKGERIRCMVPVEEGQVLLATDRGNLAVVEVETGEVLRKTSLWEQMRGEKVQELFGTGFQRMSGITCLAQSRGGILVGMENGKIFGVDIAQLRIAFEVTAKHTGLLEPIFKLGVNVEEDKVYSMHSNYILEWNYRLGSCLGYIECASPQGIAKAKCGLMVAGLSSSLWVLGGESWELGLSMRGAGVVLELGGGVVAIGGADNMVDILSDTTRLMTLIPK